MDYDDPDRLLHELRTAIRNTSLVLDIINVNLTEFSILFSYSGNGKLLADYLKQYYLLAVNKEDKDEFELSLPTFPILIYSGQINCKLGLLSIKMENIRDPYFDEFILAAVRNIKKEK